MYTQKSFLSSITNKIILINVVLYILIWILISIFGQQTILELIALRPLDILQGKKIWTLFTSIFTHFAFWHLFANMFSFYFIGNFVEKLIGQKRTLLFYLSAGLFASIFWTALSGFFGSSVLGAKIFGDPLIYGIGASGALFGFIGILSVLTPHNKVYLIAGPLLAIIIQSLFYAILPSSPIINLLDMVITFYILFSLFAMISFNQSTRKFALPLELPMWVLPIIAIVPLVIIGLFVNLPIGNMAHLGGLIIGLIYAFYLKNKYPNKTKMISRGFF